jgi:tRNA pseudouridine38-40 synthase
VTAGRRLKLVVAYDGTAYCGFQRQGRGLTSIQDVLYDAIETTFGAPPARFAAAGRTDAGVHALGQVVAFDTEGRVPSDRAAAALNANLPPDVAVVAAAEVAPGFHPRFDAVSKTYSYCFYGWGGRPRHPMLDRHALYFPSRLDLGGMDEAARVLEGRHDFSAFQDAGRPVADPTRTVLRCRVSAREQTTPPLLGLEVGWITVEAEGFLYHMVRAIAGTLLEAGRGRLTPSDVAAVLAGRQRRAGGPTVPPRGLCLVKVDYDGPRSLVDTPRAVS